MRPDDALPWQVWFDALGHGDLDDAIIALYRDIDAAVAARNPTCWLSGKCCDFDAYGHRLYVTGLEIAWLLRRLSPVGEGGSGCVFQRGKVCTVHAVRPMGCRLYFCQAGTQDWQHEQYEIFLTRLKAMHTSHDLPYAYVEWRAGLRQGSSAARSASAS